MYLRNPKTPKPKVRVRRSSTPRLPVREILVVILELTAVRSPSMKSRKRRQWNGRHDSLG
jgi:hypothetical protein